jgi:hypothetical protein
VALAACTSLSTQSSSWRCLASHPLALRSTKAKAAVDSGSTGRQQQRLLWSTRQSRAQCCRTAAFALPTMSTASSTLLPLCTLSTASTMHDVPRPVPLSPFVSTTHLSSNPILCCAPSRSQSVHVTRVALGCMGCCMGCMGCIGLHWVVWAASAAVAKHRCPSACVLSALCRSSKQPQPQQCV